MNRQPKGSLTIEASFVIPIFLFAMFMVLSVINLLRFHLNLQEAVHQETKKLAMTAYNEWNCSQGSIRTNVLKHLNGALMDKAPVKGGASGIDFSETRLNDREVIEIIASYDSELPYDSLGLFEKRFSTKCVMHTFTGYDKGLEGRTVDESKEEYVYITETGTVYHRDRECTYLRLSIKETSKDSLDTIRNSSGHKYYPCEKCGKKAGSRVYITKDGTCYHSTLHCSGLKRTVKCIPLSKVGGRGPCSRCGH